MVTYDNVTPPSTPLEAATILTAQRHHYNVKRMAISGGEPTLNRPWLTQFFRELRRLNPDTQVRLHLDTNATILTPDYVNELIEAGVTDIGPDIKGLKPETFMKITGIADKKLAERYLQNEWRITKYILDNYYPEKVFLGIGVPYNPKLVTLEEIREMGEKIASINPEVQVCLLDYFPAFRRTDINRPTITEMKKAREALVSAGLKTVLAQTVVGHIGP
jgi:pyruvate formate lyase activating enzyme